MKVKYSGTYRDASPFIKRAGAYQLAASTYVKSSGTYQAQDDSTFLGTLRLDGASIIDVATGLPISFRAYNEGHGELTDPADCATQKANGFTGVRMLARDWSEQPPYVSGTNNVSNGEGPSADWGYMLQDYVEDFLDVRVSEAVDAGLHIGFVQDSNCGQGKLGQAECTLEGQTNRNFWKTDAASVEKRRQFIERWKFIARRYRGQLGWHELMVEVFALQDDGVTPVPQTDVNAFYIECADAILSVNPDAIFVIGSINAYDIDLSSSLLTANMLAWMAEHPNKIILTNNMLNGVTVNAAMYSKMIKLRDAAVAADVPWYVNQLGTRSDAAEDPNDTFLYAGVFAVQSNGGHWANWEYRGISPDEYPVITEAGGIKVARNAAMNTLVAQTYTSLETAAVAAATAASGTILIYIKEDLSNCFQDIAGTIPCTAAGDLVGRINAVVGGTNLTAPADDTTRSILRRAPGGVGWRVEGDGATTYYVHSTTFFASGDADQQAIFVGNPTDSAAIRIGIHSGNATTNARNPYVGVSATDVGIAAWRGDDTTLRQVTGTVNLSDRAVVMEAVKATNNKDLYDNAIADGTQDTGAVGSLSAQNRTRIGATTTAGSNWLGTWSLVCMSKTLTVAASRQTIARFGGWIEGAGYSL